MGKKKTAHSEDSGQSNQVGAANYEVKSLSQTPSLRTIRNLGSGFEILEDISVIVKPIGRESDNFVASFPDANINASGDTSEEAMKNLCETIADRFLHFDANESRLGPEPRRQLSVMRRYLQFSARTFN